MKTIIQKACIGIFILLQIMILASCGNSGGGSANPSGGSSSNDPSSNTTISPTVSMMHPSNESSNIPIDTDIKLSFNQPVNNVNTSTITISSESGSLVNIASIVTESNNTYKIVPSKLFDYNTTYKVIVSSNITAIANNESIPITTFNFTTLNKTALTVSMVQPLDKSTNVPINTDIELNFSQPVSNVNSSTITMHSESGSIVAIAITAESNNTYKIQPANQLDFSTTYYIVVGRGITSVDNNEPVRPTLFYFTTLNGSIITPTVEMIKPFNESTNVPINTNIELKFSQPVSNVNTSTITIHTNIESGSLVDIASITTESNNIYKIRPNKLLDHTTTYYVEVSSDITATNSNEPVQVTTFSFTTSNRAESPTVSIINPQDNSIIESLNPEIKIQFNEPVVGVNNVTFQVRKGSIQGDVIPSQAILAESNNVYTFVPESALDGNSVYYVTINHGIFSKDTYLSVVPTEFKFITKYPSFAYVIYSSGISLCKIQADGKFSACNLMESTPTNAYSITINHSHTYAYIASRYSSGIITSCKIDRMTGLFSSCTTNTSFRTPTSIAFNATESSMYYTDGISSVYRCPISAVGNLPTYNQCGVTGGGFSGPTSMVVNESGTYSYIVNNTSKTISSCSIYPTSNSLVNCNKAATGFTNPLGTILSNNSKYLYTTNNSEVRTCTADSITGKLSLCFNQSILLSPLAAIAISHNNYIYLADTGNNQITSCQENESSGTLTNCALTKSDNKPIVFMKPTGITILDN